MSRARVLPFFFGLVALLPLFPAGAAADTIESFRFEPRVEAPLLAVGGALWLATELLKPVLAPQRCRLCGINALDEATQRRLRWPRFDAARRLSDALLFAIVPGAALGGALLLARAHGTRRTGTVDAVVVSEALVLTANLTQLTKFIVARERPFVHTQRSEGRHFVATHDDALSFFSGHTSNTFALAVAAGATASLRGYRQAPWVWGVGLPLALFTGYLRIAADRHYLTDVLAGALVGAAIGTLVPWLHARGEP